MNQDTLHIDGSQGEGGGQILRSSLALSMSVGRPFAISNIRANRSKTGLMRQHLTAVEAAAVVCGAQVEGAGVGSREVTFRPGPVRGGTHRFAIGTAGSTTMVLQAILPALLFAPEPSDITIEGGTHNRWAPPLEFLQRVFVPLINRLGAEVVVTLEGYGFYPAGGGRVRVQVQPISAASPFVLEHRGEVTSRRASVLVSSLPRDVAERELARVRERLAWEIDDRAIVHAERARGPGNAVFLEVASSGVTELFSAIGEQGKLAERVADEAIDECREYLASDAPVGCHLADQLMVPLALASSHAGVGCAFRTLPFSRHASTNAGVVDMFLPGVTRTERIDGGVRWSSEPR